MKQRLHKASRKGTQKAAAIAAPAPRAQTASLAIYLPSVILLLAVAALFFPLVVSASYYYPYVFIKSILFRAAVQIMFLLYVVLAAACPAYRPRPNRLVYALLAWFAVMLVSSLPGVSVNAWNSWWGDFARMGGMIAQLHLLGFFIVLAHTLRRERDWLTLFAASLFFGLLMGLTGLLQDLQIRFLYPASDDPRFFGATGNANFFATHMLLNFFIALWFLSRSDRSELYPLAAKVWLILLIAVDLFLGAQLPSALARYGPEAFPAGKAAVYLWVLAGAAHLLVLCWFMLRRRVAAGIGALSLAAFFFFFSMYRSQTRGAVVGVLAAVFVTLALAAWRGSWKTRLVFLTLTLLVGLSAVLLVRSRDSAWVRSRPALHRLASISPQDSSIEFRLMAWKHSSKALLDRPLFGWGVDNYRNVFDRYFPPAILNHSFYAEQWADRAHNLLLDVAIPTGLAGLATLSAFFILLLAFLIRRRTPADDFPGRPVFAALVVGYLVQSLSTFDTVNTDAVLYALLAYASYLYSQPRLQAAARMPEQPALGARDWRGWTAIAATALLTVFALHASALRPAGANRTLLLAIAQTKSKDPQSHATRIIYNPAAVELFLQADSYGTTGRYEIRQEFANYVSELLPDASLSPVVKVELVRRAAEMLDRSVREDPRNARHRLYRASLVNRALPILQRSDPGLARTLAEQNVALLDTAASLTPTRPQLYLEKGASLHALGRFEECAAVMEKGVRLNPGLREPNLDLLCSYIEAGRLDDAAAQWRKIKDAGFRLERADYDRIISLYEGKRQYAAMAELYKEQLAQKPDDVTLLPRLATVYRALGETELARCTAMRAAELSPQVAAELDKFLKSLEEKKR